MITGAGFLKIPRQLTTARQSLFMTINFCTMPFVAFMSISLTVGCSGTSLPDMGQVIGVILLDEKPLDAVEVVLVPEANQGSTAGPQASGFSDQEGRFQPQTNLDGTAHNAVVVGTYRVVLRDLKTMTTAAPDPKQEYAGEAAGHAPKPRFSPRFADLQSSPFGAVIIGPGVHELVLELNSKTKAGKASVNPARPGGSAPSS